MTYGLDKISGELDFCYDGARYLRGILDGDIYRFEVKADFDRINRYVPDISYDRVLTDLALTHGAVDSWPFTPKQIEIIGDKTWTFSGTGRFISDSGTFSWKLFSKYLAAFSYIRVHFDYSLSITTRDHLSTNPMDMMFGRRRVETDRTRYYDFASVIFRKEFSWSVFSFDTGIQQLIPIYHAESRIPGKAPAPPSFPTLKFARPKSIGGLSVWIRTRYFL